MIYELISNLTITESIASILVIISVWLISIPNFYGQILMLIAQAVWIAHSINTKQPGLIFQSVVLFAINIKAIYSWYVKGVGICTNKE